AVAFSREAMATAPEAIRYGTDEQCFYLVLTCRSLGAGHWLQSRVRRRSSVSALLAELGILSNGLPWLLHNLGTGGNPRRRSEIT
ncbi:hypothetical protein ACL8FV_30980, partial [Pseudomonas aeruginosa]|uniref:hypothetical protein n=1 Tax=Pseudomonas aeruginosa TaxID=287 RepID=UPI003B66BCB5